MILIMISAQSCYYCILWSCKRACKINNIPWWASPLLKASQLKLARWINGSPFCSGFTTSLHNTVHMFIMCPTSLLSSCALVSLTAPAISALLSCLCPSRLSFSHLTPLQAIDAETYWFLSRLLLTVHLGVSFTYTVSSTKGFFRSVKENQLHCPLDFNFQNFNSWGAADIEALQQHRTKGVFKVMLWGLILAPLLRYFKD